MTLIILTWIILVTTPVLAQDTLAKFKGSAIAQSAEERTQHEITYDGSYHSIAYPGGDVPADIGVCTDVVIRAYRTLGIDLQVQVHQDMRSHFALYPSQRIWGLRSTDRNIDHRRVPNLQVFFTRKGQSLKITQNPQDYQPGDLVTWMLPGNLPHIGIVSRHLDPQTGHPLIVHNIGGGPVMNDMLFEYPITGHYRYQVL